MNSSTIQNFLVSARRMISSSAKIAQSAKPRLVVLGTGWGSFAFAKQLNRQNFQTHIISPRNHLLFTPLLASTSVGTLEFRSIAEPVKYSMPDVVYTKAQAIEVDAATKTVTVASPSITAKSEDYNNMIVSKIPYDILVVGIGARNNTFNIPGVEENMFFLKQLSDAKNIRQRIITNFEAASLGGVSAQERRRLLSFVIVGGGPTGVEFAAELHDFVMEDVLKLYPELFPDVNITIIEGNQLLGAFDASLREYAERKFRRDRIKIRTGANVVAVEKDQVKLSDGDSIPFGLGIWNTGIGPLPLVQLDKQTFKKDRWGHITTNDKLQVYVPDGSTEKRVYPNIYALGDCASVGDHQYAATAQVAEQQGTYLAKQFNSANLAAASSVEEAVAAVQPKENFEYHHGGSLAFIGTFTAVSDFTKGSAIAPLYGTKLKGWVSWFLWRSAYLTKLGSWRNRLQVPANWTKTLLFGRDTTQF